MKYNARMVRTRIPPSPTGQDIHVGNLYTALMNWAYARKNKGKFVVRIEDTDRVRFQEGAEEKILSSIKAFGLSYDEGPDIGGPFAPYRQSERLPLYKKYAEELIEKGAAYYCFCSKERLDTLRDQQQKEKKTPRYDKYCLTHVKDAKERIAKGESYVIRLNVLPNKQLWFKDVIRGQITINSNEVDDQVLLKSDGFPTYHLGVVIDDHLMEITHIIRAEEWISSTPKHVILYEAFGWKQPVFSHLPILRNTDKSKLSKRKNPVWASWYLDEGFLPEAILNYLALLGWSHPEEKEIFSLTEFVELFDLKDINPVGPIFDLTKLKWMNGEYIRKMDIDTLINVLQKYYAQRETKDLKAIDHKHFKQIVAIAQSRLTTLKEFYPLITHFLPDAKFHISSEKEKIIAQSLREELSKVTQWQREAVMDALRKVLLAHSIRMPVLYTIVTGQERGLPLPESLVILGKELTIKKLDLAIQS